MKRKLTGLNHARETRNISRTCRYFSISRKVYYKWKRRYKNFGEEGLINGKPSPDRH
ncbi:MAG: helix-turn-helix domain-containing protein [Nitrospiraceae bacterium]|nr:MAG: helix-turn-helix domain-containing protein [Nitrospiraceae bacterium]